MSIKNLVNYVINLLEDTNLVKVSRAVWLPDKEKTSKIEVKHTPQYSMKGTVMYSNVILNIPIRGSKNDQLTQALVDEVVEKIGIIYNAEFEGGRITVLMVSDVEYAGIDENDKIIYEIKCTGQVQ